MEAPGVQPVDIRFVCAHFGPVFPIGISCRVASLCIKNQLNNGPGKLRPRVLATGPFCWSSIAFFSANEEHGNYILTTYFPFTAPTGSNAFSTKNFSITPSIAGGKGWGDFNMLLDFGINTPTGDFHKLGTPILTNAVLQYRVLKVIRPALEVNYTYWPNGLNRGKNQVFLLPEIILGSIELHGRVTWSIGAGYQFAVSHAHPQYENSWIVSFRVNW